MWRAKVQLSGQDYRPYFRLLLGDGQNVYDPPERLCEIVNESATKNCCHQKDDDKEYANLYKSRLVTVLLVGSPAPNSSLSSPNDKDPILFVWTPLAKCYNLKPNQSISLNLIEPPHLVCSKIVLAVNDRSTADRLCKFLSDFDEKLEPGRHLVVAKNDWLWWRREFCFQAVVMDTEPANQGLVTTATSATVLVVDKQLRDFAYDHRSITSHRSTRKFIDYFQLVHYTLLYLNMRRLFFGVFVKSLYRNLHKSIKPIGFKKLPSKLCKCMRRLEENFDFHSTIFLHPYLATLLNAKNEFHQVIHYVTCSKKRDKRLVKIKHVQFCCSDCLLKNSDWEWSCQLLCHQSLIFNMQNPTFVEFGQLVGSTQIRLAKDVKISMIACPSYTFDIVCDNYLTNYFDNSRIVKHSDVFCIEKQSQQSGPSDDNYIYFKIVEISLYPNERLGNAFSDLGLLINCVTSTMVQKVTLADLYAIKPNSICIDDSKNNLNIFTSILETKISAYQRFSRYLDVYLTFLIVSNVSNYIPRLDMCDTLEYIALKHCFNAVNPFVTSVLSSKHAEHRRRVSTFLFTGPPGTGKTALAKLIASSNCMHYYELDCYELWSDVAGNAEAKLKNAFHRAQLYAPVVLCLKNLEIVGRDQHSDDFDPRVVSYFASCIQQQSPSHDRPMVIIGTTHHVTTLSQSVLSCFLYQQKFNTLTDNERKDVLRYFVRTNEKINRNLDVLELTQHTAGFVLADFYQLLADSKYSAIRRLIHYNKDLFKNRFLSKLYGYSIETEDMLNALHQLQSSVADALGTPRVPDVKWEDVGGLQDVKDTIYDTIQLSLEHPELFSKGLRRSGVLLYGPPGCGKTLLAKAVATECSLTFISVKGPELLNMYVGQSEQNVRELFERARGSAPCVIFFDELDALAPNRGRSGDSGGVMDRVVSQLLAELDGIQSKTAVFVIGATNRPDLIDPSLLRPGRFDKILYVGIGDDDESRLNVLRAVTRKLKTNPNLNMVDVVRMCPDNMSGADFYALAAEAATNAASRLIERIESELSNPNTVFDQSEYPSVVVEIEDFRLALKYLTPSVPLEDLVKYKELRMKI